jgi:hypothetical protein
METEMGLVNTNLPSNITLTQEHVDHATAHIDTNTTKELAEKNKRVADDLTTDYQICKALLEQNLFLPNRKSEIMLTILMIPCKKPFL